LIHLEEKDLEKLVKFSYDEKVFYSLNPKEKYKIED
jgi:hypothetical protein